MLTSLLTVEFIRIESYQLIIIKFCKSTLKKPCFWKRASKISVTADESAFVMDYVSLTQGESVIRLAPGGFP